MAKNSRIEIEDYYYSWRENSIKINKDSVQKFIYQYNSHGAMFS